MVDDSLYPELSVHRWFLDSSTGYAVRNQKVSPDKYRKVYMHRQVAGLKPGDRKQVDHDNENKLDNQRVNLIVKQVGEHRTRHCNDQWQQGNLGSHTARKGWQTRRETTREEELA
jgi:hypothetical protein